MMGVHICPAGPLLSCHPANHGVWKDIQDQEGGGGGDSRRNDRQCSALPRKAVPN